MTGWRMRLEAAYIETRQSGIPVTQTVFLRERCPVRGAARLPFKHRRSNEEMMLAARRVWRYRARRVQSQPLFR